MSEIREVKFRFVNFFVRESHIVFKEQGDPKFAINFNANGYVFKNLNQFHLELFVDIKEETEKFHIHLNTISVFEFPEDTTEEAYTSNYFTLNAPALAFPYIRAYISNLTAQSGLFTITLPTYNLTAMGEKLRENIQVVD
jgi:preprotein translocase subunit SecB